MPFNIPILLTWLRIILIPLFIGVYYVSPSSLGDFEKNQLATLLFGLAAITDWFDGYLARRWNQTSAFGAFLDPVADKLMVAAALIILVKLQRTDAILAMIIIGREITISALREWMAQMGARASIAVSYVGKIKTTAQMVAILVLLFAGGTPPIFPLLNQLGIVSMWVAAALTIWTMLYYLKKALPFLRGK